MFLSQFPFRTILGTGAIWVISDIGYYTLPFFGVRSSYNHEPVGITIYYFIWISITLFLFWPAFKKWNPIRNVRSSLIFLVVFYAALVLFVSYVVPNLPSIIWTETWDPPELMVANPWYFLPKSFDILLQQLLIAVIVLALYERKFSLNAISIGCMIAFGGAHILLAFDGMPFSYVTRFMLSAMAFGYFFPSLIIKVPNGFAYSYALHWSYYAVTLIMMHTVSPYAKWSIFNIF